MTQLLPPKKDVSLALLERSNVDVYLDPRAKGVVVPPQFRKEPRLILKIGLNMPVPIPDLRLDDDGMSCTLSFNRSPFYCIVPWQSVFAMVGEDGRGMVWPDDVPQELAVKVVDPGDESGKVGRDAPASTGAASSRGRGGKKSSSAERAGEARAESERGGRSGKKGRKKKEEAARPVLVAVGGEAVSSKSAEKSADRERRERRPEAATPAPSPAPAQSSRAPDGVTAVPSSRPPVPPSQRPGMGAPRPKRELPPYLRVVK